MKKTIDQVGFNSNEHEDIEKFGKGKENKSWTEKMVRKLWNVNVRLKHKYGWKKICLGCVHLHLRPATEDPDLHEKLPEEQEAEAEALQNQGQVQELQAPHPGQEGLLPRQAEQGTVHEI